MSVQWWNKTKSSLFSTCKLLKCKCVFYYHKLKLWWYKQFLRIGFQDLQHQITDFTVWGAGRVDDRSPTFSHQWGGNQEEPISQWRAVARNFETFTFVSRLHSSKSRSLPYWCPLSFLGHFKLQTRDKVFQLSPRRITSSCLLLWASSGINLRR